MDNGINKWKTDNKTNNFRLGNSNEEWHNSYTVNSLTHYMNFLISSPVAVVVCEEGHTVTTTTATNDEKFLFIYVCASD